MYTAARSSSIKVVPVVAGRAGICPAPAGVESIREVPWIFSLPIRRPSRSDRESSTPRNCSARGTNAKPYELTSLAIPLAACVCRLDDHLGDALAAEGLAADKVLALETGKAIAERGEQKEDTSSNQARRHNQVAEKLDDGHDKVCGGAQVVGRDLANEGVKLGRRGADAKQQRDFDEQDDKSRGAGKQLAVMVPESQPGVGATYIARAQKMMSRGWTVKMLAMPRARHRIIERTPSLDTIR